MNQRRRYEPYGVALQSWPHWAVIVLWTGLIICLPNNDPAYGKVWSGPSPQYQAEIVRRELRDIEVNINYFCALQRCVESDLACDTDPPEVVVLLDITENHALILRKLGKDHSNTHDFERMMVRAQMTIEDYESELRLRFRQQVLHNHVASVDRLESQRAELNTQLASWEKLAEDEKAELDRSQRRR
jgi:hypothetical protein